VNSTVVVNLGNIRKEKNRTEAKAKANSNALKFGMTKLEKAMERARHEMLNKTLDGAKRE
jgi:hypothetical protein